MELNFNKETWRKMLSLAKKIDQRHSNDSFAGYVDGTKTIGSQGDSLRKAKRFAKLLAWLLGEDELFFMINPNSGEMRSIIYSYTDYSETTAGLYVEQ